jgi:predicted transcriptional regulator
MNSHPFDIIPVVNPNNEHVIGIVTTQGIMNLLTETSKS